MLLTKPAKPPTPCRECQRPTRWCRGEKNPAGPLCYDCAAKYRARPRPKP